MKKLFEYGGKVSQQFFTFDTADIHVYNWFQSINVDVLTDREKELVNQLQLNIGINDVRQSITMSDNRCKFIATKLMAKYENLKEIDLRDYIIVYQTLITIYEKSFDGIDLIIRYLNLLMGYAYSKDKLTRDEAIELRELQNSILSILKKNADNQNDIWFINYLPSFVINSLTEKFEVDEIINIKKEEPLIDEKELKKVKKQKEAIDDVLSEKPKERKEKKTEAESDIKEQEQVIEEFLDTPQDVPQEEILVEDIKEQSEEVKKEDLEYKPTAEELKKIRKYELYITNLDKLLKTMNFDEKDKREIREAVETYQEFLDDIKRGKKFAVGGLVQMYSSPQIVDGMYSVISTFDKGGETNQSNLKKFTFSDGSAFIVHFDDDNGRMVNPKLQRVTQQERITSILLNEKSLAELALERMNENDITFVQGLMRLVKGKVFVSIYAKGGLNLRVMKDANAMNNPYYLWDSNSGKLIADFSTEEDATAYIEFANKKAQDSEGLSRLSINELIQDEQEKLNQLMQQRDEIKENIQSFMAQNSSDDKVLFDYYNLERDIMVQIKDTEKELAHYQNVLKSLSGSELGRKQIASSLSLQDSKMDKLKSQLNQINETIDLLTSKIENGNWSEMELATIQSSLDSLNMRQKQIMDELENFDEGYFAKGGMSKFDKLSSKVAKNYEGKRVPKEYQKEYGKTYDAQEAKVVGDKVASHVYRLQLAKNKMNNGGEVDEDNLTYAEASKRWNKKAGLPEEGFQGEAIKVIKENPEILMALGHGGSIGKHKNNADAYKQMLGLNTFENQERKKTNREKIEEAKAKMNQNKN